MNTYNVDEYKAAVSINTSHWYRWLGSFNGGWISQYQDDKQFLQIDLQKVTNVTGIATQGRYDAGWWSKTYTLEYSVHGEAFVPYISGNEVRYYSLLPLMLMQTVI